MCWRCKTAETTHVLLGSAWRTPRAGPGSLHLLIRLPAGNHEFEVGQFLDDRSGPFLSCQACMFGDPTSAKVLNCTYDGEFDRAKNI